jgi:hypothetical protein
MPVTNPEDESRVLVNSMDSYQRSDASLVGKKKFNCQSQNYRDIRKFMQIESAKQDKYVDVICYLLDESVRFNDSQRVSHIT